MTKNPFELPDMDDLARQMEEAMSEAQKAMEDLPKQTSERGNVMGALSGLMEGMPAQMESLTSAMAGFETQHEANVASLAGEPDWSVEASIQVGKTLHVVVHAAFDLKMIRDAWRSTQSGDFESLVEGTVAEAGGEIEAGMMGQIMEQLQKGRSVAVVESIDVLVCRIQGAPGDAAEELQLSPEANIPLAVDESGLGFEFAPLLTIRNQWERAAIPTFSPMGAEIVVPLKQFESEETFTREFEPAGQENTMTVTLKFQPLA